MTAATGTYINDLLKQYIFSPLGLKNTTYSHLEVDHSILHSWTNDRSNLWDDSTYWDSSWGGIATSINSDAHDMNVLARTIGQGSLISKKSFDQLVSQTKTIPPTNPYYAMGLVVGGFDLDYLKTKDEPLTVIWSNQSFGGYMGMWAYIPSYKLSITLETNNIDKNHPFKIEDIMKSLLNRYTLDQLACIATL